MKKAAKEKKYATISGGLKGTDNCPVCGEAMKKEEGQFLGVDAIKLYCTQHDHSVLVYLKKDEVS